MHCFQHVLLAKFSLARFYGGEEFGVPVPWYFKFENFTDALFDNFDYVYPLTTSGINNAQEEVSCNFTTIRKKNNIISNVNSNNIISTVITERKK